jgi:alpha-tubulin suppressor-like RCC1 family protein
MKFPLLFASTFVKRGAKKLKNLLTEFFNLFSNRDFIVITFFTILGMGGVFAAGLVTLTPSESQGAGYLRATACDENVTIRALTASDAATGQLYVATIALSDISQNATTGCGNKTMQVALKINDQMRYATWDIPAASTDSTFYLTGVTSSLSNYYADTLLSPFQADGLTNVAIANIGVFSSNGSISISAGYYHTCAVLSTGAVKCWGYNGSGQIGDNTQTSRLTPVAVSGLSSGVTAISAGYYHTCAVLSTGAVKCWGYNGSGQIGDNTKIQRLTPVAVSGLSSGVTAISAGFYHSCALLSTGAVKCWGDNGNGQIGDDTQIQRLTPVAVSGLSSGVTAISAGYQHTCAVLSTGAVKCWGDNGSGQIGDNTQTSRLTPVAVSGLSSGVTAISAGYQHTCAVLSTGAVKCWGDNGSGQIGDNTQTSRLTPVAVSGLSSGVTAISAGYYHACAVLSTGAVKCWGDNDYGQIGDNTQIDRKIPVAVSGLSSGVTAISASFYHSCALLSTGAVKCWGVNGSGRIGDNTETQRLTPVAVSGIGVITR